MHEQPPASVSSLCPSCTRETKGNYCAHCGERTVNNKPDLRFVNFITVAIRELFDLDSKFLRTLKFLFLKPGFLALELLKGKRNLYINPLRLYVVMTVAHFLFFNSIPSGDIFNIDRFPIMQFAPVLKQMIEEKKAESKISHDEFTAEISMKVKDNLSFMLYLVVFGVAVVVHFLYLPFGRYYVEHLHFVFHVFSFALARNILLIPLVMLDLIPVAMVVGVGSQLAYTFMALKTVYPQGNVVTGVKLMTMMMTVCAVTYVIFHISVFMALEALP